MSRTSQSDEFRHGARMLPRTGLRRLLPETYPGCWKQREFIRAYNRASEQIRRMRGVRSPYASVARPKCFNCRRAGVPLELIDRLVLGPDAREHAAKVLWCGEC